MLRIPNSDSPDLDLWCRELVDECMTSREERGMMYTRAGGYYYTGTYGSRAAIHNKIRPFVDRLSGFLMQPTDVRFNLVYDSTEPDTVLNQSQVASEKLTADYRQSDSDVLFSNAVTWSLVNGCQLLKHVPTHDGFKVYAVHPENFGVLTETVLELEDQEAFCHVSFPTLSKLSSMLLEIDHPRRDQIIAQILESRQTSRDEEESTYFHQLVVGGLQPVGNVDGEPPSAAGIVQVFPIPTPWRPQRRISRTVKLCELWIRDVKRGGDWTTVQLVYPDIIIEGKDTRRNLSKIPGRQPFIKIQPTPTPGYFWGRSIVADVQMLQDLINKRLLDIKIMWDRNANAPQIFSGFTSVTEEQYYKIVSEGGFINDTNPNAKAQPLFQPPPQGYLEELEFIWKMFDEQSGFTPIMSGQGESGVRAGVHAQTLVRTSSPRLIAQAASVERQLAESGYLSFRLMQAMDGKIYSAEDGSQFLLGQLPDNFQCEVDSHSASPAFAEDNRQVAVGLARAGAIDAEDLIHMLHPPGAELLLARLKQRQKAQAQAQQQQKQEELIRDVIGLPNRGGGRQQGGGGKGRR